MLDVFQVSADQEDEYRAANTTTGTRYDTPVKDLPMQLDVMTQSFLRDIDATTVRDALEFSSGVQLNIGSNTPMTNPENGGFTIRGFGVPATLKDGFQHFFPTDAITIGRVDVIKGPGGAIYGESSDGGVVQTAGIRAGDTPSTFFKETVGTYDKSRTELLWSGPLDSSDRVGLALPIAYTTQRSSEMYNFQHFFVFNPTVTIKVGPKTTLLVEYELMALNRASFSNGGGFQITDTALAPNGTPYGVLIPGRQPNGQRVLATPNQQDFRWDGPDTYRDNRYQVQTYRIDHAFTDNLQFWVGWNYADSHVKNRDFSITLRNANDSSIPLSIRSNPQFIALERPAFGTAQPQVLDIRPNTIQPDLVTTYPTIKSELFTKFDLGPVENRLILGGSQGATRQGNFTPNVNYYFGNTNTPTDPTTQAWEALPAAVILSPFGSPLAVTTDEHWHPARMDQNPHGPAIGNPADPAYRSIAYFYNRNLYANLQSSFFSGKLQTILGWIDNRDDRQTRVFGADGNVLWAGPAPIALQSVSAPSGVMRPIPIRRSAPNGTVIWLPRDDIRLYANAQSVTDPGPSYSARDGNGIPLTAPVYTNHEVGMRLEEFSNKLLFDVSVFRMTVKTLPVAVGNAIQNQTINFQNGQTITSGFGNNAQINTSQVSSGYELKLDYLPLSNLRIHVGFTKADVRITGVSPFVTPANPNPVILAAQQAYVAAGGNDNAYIGTNPTDVSKYTGNGYVRYDFRSGFLKGLWAMIDAHYYGPQTALSVGGLTGLPTDIPTYTTTYFAPHYLSDLRLGYALEGGSLCVLRRGFGHQSSQRRNLLRQWILAAAARHQLVGQCQILTGCGGRPRPARWLPIRRQSWDSPFRS